MARGSPPAATTGSTSGESISRYIYRYSDILDISTNIVSSWQGQAGAGPQHARVPDALRRRLLRRRVSRAPRGSLLRQADAGALPRGAVQGHVIIRWNLSRQNLRVSYLSELWIHVDGEWLNKKYPRNVNVHE